MGRRARRDNRGLTLIEVMISLAILFIVFLGLLETVRISTEFNLRNAVNSEAVRIADNVIGFYRTLPYDNLALQPPSFDVSRRVRMMDVRFRVDVAQNAGSIRTRTVTVTVSPRAPARFLVVPPTTFSTIIRNPGA